MKRINVIQYIAYFPPHIGGLESHAAEWAKRRTKQGYGKSIVATYSIGQPDQSNYEINGYTVVVIPAFEIIPTFPFPKFRTKQYKYAHRLLRSYDVDIIVTRTRFFWSSIMGGIYAKLWGKRRIHIEHGVDHVKLGSKSKELIAWIYDQTFGRVVFRTSDKVIGISQGCKRFAMRFTNKENIPVIYRGVEFTPSKHEGSPDKFVNLLFVGRLAALKGVDIILQACRLLINEGVVNRRLNIIGDGEERERLEEYTKILDLQKYVTFEGYQQKKYLETKWYPHADICINASYQEGLPTSVIEPLITGCLVVATAVGGTIEISDKDDLILVRQGDVNELHIGIRKAVILKDTVKGDSTKLVKKKFDRSISIKKYSELFLKIKN